MNRVRNLRASLEYEFETNYRFPVLEGIVAIIIMVSVASALDLAVRYVNIIQTWPSDPDYATANMGFLFSSVQAHSLQVFGLSAYRVTLFLAFLVPLLIAYNLARGFEEGTFQTLLTYPIPRMRLLLFKTLIPIGIIGLTTNLAILLTVLLTVPGQYSGLTLLALSLGFWAHVVLMVSVMTLISVFLKKTLPTALAGIGIWYGFSLVLATPDFPQAITSFINPIIVIMKKGLTENLSDLYSVAYSAIFSTMILGLVMLTISYFVLQYSEV